jgi:HNH endonuclease
VALATEGPCKPVEVRVTVDSAALARGHTQSGERCEITGVGPVPVTTARALLDDAAVTVLTRTGDDITAVSSPKRTIPVKLRRALEAKHPICAVKGCANDQFLEIDHIVPLEHHGRTEIDNLWRICSHHHALKTHGGWVVVPVDGVPDLVPPDDPDPPVAAAAAVSSVGGR